MAKTSGAVSKRGPDGPQRAQREKPQQIADEIRRLIIEGELVEGELLGHEPELIERFGVSRPSLREGLRILEAEGLITVVRGVHGGVRIHQPDHRQAARTAALVLQARNVSLADVSEARTILEPAAVRIVAQSRGHKGAAKELRVAHRPAGGGHRRPGRVRSGQRPVPRDAGQPRGQPDDDDPGRDAERGRHEGGERGEPGRGER